MNTNERSYFYYVSKSSLLYLVGLLGYSLATIAQIFLGYKSWLSILEVIRTSIEFNIFFAIGFIFIGAFMLRYLNTDESLSE